VFLQGIIKVNKKKLLIINRTQFGYHIDTFYYCKYLKDQFEITYFSFDTKREKISMNGIKTIYIENEGSLFKKAINFIKSARDEIQNNNYDIVFINYFQASSLVKVGFDQEKFIIDVRTGAIGRTPRRRAFYNAIMVYEIKKFKYRTIISQCLQSKLKIPKTNTYILPLGSDVLSTKSKFFQTIKLLYVGTLDSRNIHETVIAVARFLKKNNTAKLTYDIFGSGYNSNELRLKEVIRDEKLNDIVLFHGRKEHSELKYYFDNCNIGVSYVPITDYFDCQPPTKTYEYINSGMFCIATKTQANMDLISPKNGVLCLDNPESFSDALEYVSENMHTFDSKDIQETLEQYNWNSIIKNNLIPVFNKTVLKAE